MKQHLSLAAVGALFLALLGVGLIASTGGVVAEVEGNTSNFTAVGNDTLANDTLAVTNDTRSLYVELDNESHNATEPANITVYGVDNGTETQVDQAQITAANDSVEMYEYVDVDATTYGEYRILVEGNSSAIESDALDVGTVAKVSSGGGFLGGAGDSSLGIGAIAVLVGLFLFKREE